jgi:uncharacterized protein
MVSQATVFKPSRNLRIIAAGNKALLYNAFYGRGLVCHRNMLDLVEALQPGISMNRLRNRYPQANLEASIRKLKEKGLIVENGYPEPNLPYRLYPPDMITSGAVINKLRLNVAMTGSMQCAYCYVDTADQSSADKMMAWPTAQKALDVFFDLQQKHHYEQSIIRFFGGEPLLNWPLISHCLDYIRKINSGIVIEYILNTNGTVFSVPMAKKLAQHKVGLAVSVDGTAKNHDRFRKFKTGSGTLRVIMTNLERFLAGGCNVGVEVTAGDHNIFRLDKLVLLIADLQDKYGINIPLSFQHLSVVDRKNLNTTAIGEKVEQLLKLLDFADLHGVRADTGLAHSPFNALKGQRGGGAYCRAIGDELCITPDGSVYPCGALAVKLGTIDNIEAVFKSDSYHQLVHRVAGNIPSCRGCEIEAFCAGGCVADVFTAEKAVNSPPEKCALERKLFQGLVKRFLLSPENFSYRASD